MFLMIAMGVMMVIGLGLTLWWGSSTYLTWHPGDAPSEGDRPVPSIGGAAQRYLRGVLVALVAGVWAGALVTGPAMRLVMRLLAATAGDAAQGRRTEATEIVGSIDFDGTLGLYVFGGLLPGLLSGFIYLMVRRWLPAGRMGGVVFGLLHLVIGATRIDPLRPDNVDFALVGPGWLSVLSFGLAAIFHGMAVAAIANRYSHVFPQDLARDKPRATRIRAAAPAVIPLLLLIPGVFLLFFIAAGLVFSLGLQRLPDAPALSRNPLVLRLGRIVGVVVAAVYLPWTVMDLASIVSEPQTANGSAADRNED